MRKKKQNSLLLTIGSGLHFKYNTSITLPQSQSVSQFELQCVQNHMKVHYKVREMYEKIAYLIVFALYNFIVKSSGNIFGIYVKK